MFGSMLVVGCVVVDSVYEGLWKVRRDMEEERARLREMERRRVAGLRLRKGRKDERGGKFA